jgi:regulator of replication initiation timing
MDYDIIDSADMAEQALSQAVDEHIDKSKEVINQIESLEQRLRSWNLEDIRELKTMITTMRSLLKKNFQVQIENFINMNRIPTERAPEVLKKAYHIVGVDKRGYALYGPDMDKIAHIKKIAEHYQCRVAAKKQAQAEKK